MTPMQTAVMTVLWGVVGVLAMLVFLLYRQVDRAYRASEKAAGSQLAIGQRAPAIELVNDDGFDMETPGIPDELSVMLFVTPTCEPCRTAVSELAAEPYDTPVTVLVLGEALTGTFYSGERDWISLRWPSSVADAIRSYGLGATPFAYVLRGDMVLASGEAASRAAVDHLVHDAARAAETLEAEVAVGPVPVEIEDRIPAART